MTSFPASAGSGRGSRQLRRDTGDEKMSPHQCSVKKIVSSLSCRQSSREELFVGCTLFVEPDRNMSKRPGSPLESSGPSKIYHFFESKSVHDAKATPNKNSSVVDAGSVEDKNADNQLPKTEDSEPGKLEQLLCFDSVSSEAEVDARFVRIAHELLSSNYRIRIQKSGPSSDGTQDYVDLQLLEIEFYLISPNVHEDPFCHGSPEQARAGCWSVILLTFGRFMTRYRYFHRAPRSHLGAPTERPSVGGGYRTGSRKGMDLTIGAIPTFDPSYKTDLASPSSFGTKARGGILIRSARVIKTDAIVSGPSLLADFILRSHGVEEVQDLVGGQWSDDITAFPPESNEETARTCTMTLVHVPRSSPFSKAAQYRTPRIGLDLSHASSLATPSNPRVKFVQRSYRFMTEPHLLKVNGRSQTFIGLLQHFLDRKHGGAKISSLSNGEKQKILHEVEKVGSFTTKLAKTYLGHFEGGVADGGDSVGAYCGQKGKGVCQSPEKLLRMFGALGELSSGEA